MLAEVYCKVWHKGHIPVRTAFGGVSIAGAPVPTGTRGFLALTAGALPNTGT